jgi:DNA-binding protein H-NS
MRKKKETIKELKEQGLVKTADQIPVPEPKNHAKIAEQAFWITQIEELCNKDGITPQDLIECYQAAKGGKKGLKTPKEPKNTQPEVKPSKFSSNFSENLRKAKCGL